MSDKPVIGRVEFGPFDPRVSAGMTAEIPPLYVPKPRDAELEALRARVAEAERQLRAIVFNTHTIHDLAKAKEDAIIWLTPRAGVPDSAPKEQK